jgi:hypothetical protein
MFLEEVVAVTTTATDPWGPNYVPLAQRRLAPQLQAVAWVDAEAQRRDEQRPQRPVRPVAVTQPVPTAVLAEQERRRARRAGAWRAWGSGALLLLAFGAALIAYDRALVPALRDVEAAASRAVVGSTICAVAQDANAATTAAMAERDRRLQEAGLLEEGEALSVLDTSAADALCGD